VVEGVTSVWRIGAPSVALFGKSMAAGQKHLLRSIASGKPIITLLDADAYTEMEGIVHELRLTRSEPVIPIHLAPGYDPADYSRGEIVGIIRGEAARHGAALPSW
jgi:hypothetical protein